jgi:hypothetical protein
MTAGGPIGFPAIVAPVLGAADGYGRIVLSRLDRSLMVSPLQWMGVLSITSDGVGAGLSLNISTVREEKKYSNIILSNKNKQRNTDNTNHSQRLIFLFISKKGKNGIFTNVKIYFST